jgi:zinc and cadmium transporter
MAKVYQYCDKFAKHCIFSYYLGMANYGHILFFSLLGGVISLAGGLFLLSRRKWAEALARYATPFAAGALLAAVFLDLLKEGIHESDSETVLISALVGILLFFFAERFLRWFHHHHQGESKHTDPTTGLIIAGDTLHNILDGIAIAASFLVSVPTGIITTLAVAAHEIPQEIGDFGLLLNKGIGRKKVLWFNVFSALATTAAAVITFWLGGENTLPIGILLGLSAGFLLYIALSDIIPTIHDETPKEKLLDIRPFLLVLGVLVVGLSVTIAHRYIDTAPETDTIPANSVRSLEDH